MNCCPEPNKMNLPAQAFQLSEKSSGRILKVHKSVELEDGSSRRVPMQLACFTDCQRRCAILTERRQVYVFDFDILMYWIVTLDIERAAGTAMQFVPGSITQLIVGTQMGELIELNVETGQIKQSHQLSPETVLYINYNSADHPRIAVAHTPEKIFMFDPNTPIYSLDKSRFDAKSPFTSNTMVKVFCPINSKYVLVYSSEKIYFWNTETRRVSITLNPTQIRDQYLSSSGAYKEIDIFPRRDEIKNGEDIISLCCSSERTGEIICIGFRDGFLLLSKGNNDWKNVKVEKFIKIPRLTLVGCAVLSIGDGKIFCLMHTNKDLVIVNPENLKFKVLLEQVSIMDVVTSVIGSKIATIIASGECLIFDLLEICSTNLFSDDLPTKHHNQLAHLNKEIENIIPRPRLLAILREFNEFPQKYRPVIWKTLLCLPQNIAGFSELAKRQLHPCTDSYHQQFPLKDATVARNLSRTMSCLAHWSKVFGLMELMPRFVFPFLKVFANDSLLCFEAIATILLNQGQLWFEFAPLAPTNYLGLVENILGHFDPKLLQFYRSKKVTSAVYALSLIESAFTEVLTEPQWYSLWDNIVSSPPYFPIFCIVALNIAMKPTIMRMETLQTIAQLFDEQMTCVDIVTVVRLARALMQKCPEDLSPRQYFKSFRPLNDDQYQPFLAYPRELVDKVVGVKSMSSVQSEVRLVNEKLVELEQMKLAIERFFDDEQRRIEHGHRLAEVERAYESAVRDVERASIYNH